MSYRDMIDIYERSEADGEPIPTFTGAPIYRSVPCTINTTKGAEYFRGRQLEANTTHVVDARMLPNITASMMGIARGRLEGRQLNFRAIIPVDQKHGRPQVMWIDCEEQVDQ